MRVIRRFAGAVGVALALFVAAAPAASAHALLLRTDPSPQTTVAKAPTSVRLFFSEPVEVAVGSIRVYDVDGNRVDTGSVRHGAQRSGALGERENRALPDRATRITRSRGSSPVI